MEPEIRYCATADGVSIAYYAMGEGPTLLIASSVLGNNVRYSQIFMPEYQRDGEGVGRGMRVVRYDARGSGMSDRAALDFSLEGRVRDMDGVVAKLGLTTFALAAATHGCLAAVEYAARNPEKVSKLVLADPIVDGAAARQRMRRYDSLRDMANEEWEDYTNVMAAANVGYDRPELIATLAQRMRESMSPASVQTAIQALATIDVRPSLAKLSMSTLVMYRHRVPGVVRLEDAQAVASAIPNAEFAETSLRPGKLWSQADTDAIERFLGIAPEPTAVTTPPDTSPEGLRTATGVLKTILFTDIEANTSLLQRVGDAAWREILRECERITRSVLAAHDGTEVKVMGDAFMASFSSASAAIDCAVALQRAFAERAESSTHGLRVRIGINAGEPIAEDNDLYGTAVTMAARVQALAKGGEILVSDVVRQLVAGKSFLFHDRGETALRGFEDPVRLYEVRWQTIPPQD